MKTRYPLIFVVLLAAFIFLPSSASAQSGQDDDKWLDPQNYTIYWGEEVNASGYIIKAVEFSPSKYGDQPDDFVVLSIESNRSESWSTVLALNNSYIPDTKNLDDKIKISAIDVVTGNRIPTPYTEVRVSIAKEPPARSTVTWVNATLDVQRGAAHEIYIDERAHVRIEITNLKELDLKNIEINETIPEGLILDPDGDIGWKFDLSGNGKRFISYSLKALKPGNYTLPSTEVMLPYMGVDHYKYTNESQLVVHGPHITVQKELSVSRSHLDGIVDVKLNVKNEGDRAAYVEISDVLPEGAIWVKGNMSDSLVMRPSSSHVIDYSLRMGYVGDVVVPAAEVEFTDPRGNSEMAISRKTLIHVVAEPEGREMDGPGVHAMENETSKDEPPVETSNYEEVEEKEGLFSGVRSVRGFMERMMEVVDSSLSGNFSWFQKP